MESSFPDAGDAIWNVDLGQPDAVLKGPISDAGDAIRDGDGYQTLAPTERVRLNPSDWETINCRWDDQIALGSFVTTDNRHLTFKNITK